MIPYRPQVARMVPRTTRITSRQAQCLDLLCDGFTARQMASQFGVTEDTVKTTLRRLYRALGARDRAHAVGLVLTGRVTVLVRDGGESRWAA